MRIFRYLTREVLLTTGAILFVMLFIMLMSQTAIYLSKMASGAIAFGFVGKLILINIPMLASYILPFAFYIGLLLGYGRLYAESEMIILQASGFSDWRLFLYTFGLGTLTFIVTAYLILILNPYFLRDKGEIINASYLNILQTMVPGRFRSLDHGNVILYVSSANRDHTKFHNVFLAQMSKAGGTRAQDEWTVSYMNNVHQVNINQQLYLQTENSSQYKGVPGQAEYTISHYQTLAKLIPDAVISEQYTDVDGMKTSELMKHHDAIKATSELEWRFALVAQVLILTLLAIPLSRVQPRQGRYAKMLPAILFYFVFANVLFVARYLFESGKTAPRIGIWWASVVMLVVVLIYYALRYRWFRK